MAEAKTKLFFGNLDYSITEDDLKAFLSQTWNLVEVKLQHTAALIDLNLLAVIDIPVPEPHTKIPTSLFFPLILRANFFA